MQKHLYPLLFLGGSLMIQIASGQACVSVNASLSGAYGFVAVQTGTVAAGASTSFSSTEIGQLLSGVASSGLFSSSGAFYFDGAGNVFGMSAQGGMNTSVGTYSVSADCSVTVALKDTFGPNPNPPATNFAGVELNGGNEVDLGLASSGSTSGALFTSPIGLRLVRPYSSSGACAVANLSGSYALISRINMPLPVAPPGTTLQPFNIIRVKFDGNGKVISDTVVSPSPLGFFQQAGTYTVNADCSGTMTIASMTVNFVLTEPMVTVNSGVLSLSSYQLHPGIQFAASNTSAVISGTGTAQ